MTSQSSAAVTDIGHTVNRRTTLYSRRVSGLRDYMEWHKAYDDPGSPLSWRLAVVQRYLDQALDEHPGPLVALSLCAGEGRDLLDVLHQRDDAQRVTATLIEIDNDIAEKARIRAAEFGLSNIELRVADAGNTRSYVDAVPADLLLLVGIFGNISDADVEGTIKAAPQFCRHGATVIWSRGRDRGDFNGGGR